MTNINSYTTPRNINNLRFGLLALVAGTGLILSACNKVVPSVTATATIPGHVVTPAPFGNVPTRTPDPLYDLFQATPAAPYTRLNHAYMGIPNPQGNNFAYEVIESADGIIELGPDGQPQVWCLNGPRIELEGTQLFEPSVPVASTVPVIKAGDLCDNLLSRPTPGNATETAVANQPVDIGPDD